MHPTLFTIGNWSLSTYTLLLDLGLLLGLVLAYWEGKRLYGAGERTFDASLWAIIAGVLGGRAGYVLVHWSDFSEEWVRAFYIWEGGLSFHGAFLGGLAALALLAFLQRRAEKPLSFWMLADAVTLGLSLGIAFGWAACLMGGCAYGAVGEGWGRALLPDIYGIEAYRFATQAMGMGFALLLFVGIWLLRRRWPFPGARFLTYTLLYFAGHFFLEFTRGDEALYFGPWRLAQVVDIVFVLVSAGALLLLWRRTGPVQADLADREPPVAGLGAAEESGGGASPPRASVPDASAADEFPDQEFPGEEAAPGEPPDEPATCAED